MLTILQQLLAIKFNITQGQELCFFEELPKGAKLAGKFGALASQSMPSVSFKITHNNNQSAHGTTQIIVYDQSNVNDTLKFRLETEYSGVYDLCFNAMEISSNPLIKREVWLDLDIGEIPMASDDKVGAAEQILQLAEETILDQEYSKQRLQNLVGIGSKTSRIVLLVGVVSVVVAWAVVLLQNAWLSMQIKKRL